MKYLTNAIALSMLPRAEGPLRPWLYPLHDAKHAARELLDSGDGPWESIVGHADTATLFGRLLGCDVEARRVTVSLDVGDLLIVGQYRGPRLPEGATQLPDGAAIQWWEMVIAAEISTDDVTAEVLREERYGRKEHNDSMRSDWNEDN